jgi:hypothetical protein
MLLCCHTLPLIDARHIPMCNPGQCPPHNAIIDVEFNQHVPDFVRHVLHRVKAMCMWLMIAADSNAESNSINDGSPATLRKLLSSRS